MIIFSVAILKVDNSEIITRSSTKNLSKLVCSYINNYKNIDQLIIIISCVYIDQYINYWEDLINVDYR